MKPLYQLVHIRRARGFSQAHLGEAAGLSQKYISDLEPGRRPNDWTHVQRIAGVLEVEPSALTAEKLTVITSPSGNVAIAHG